LLSFLLFSNHFEELPHFFSLLLIREFFKKLFFLGFWFISILFVILFLRLLIPFLSVGFRVSILLDSYLENLLQVFHQSIISLWVDERMDALFVV